MNSFIEHYLRKKVAGYVHDDIKDVTKYHLFNMGESFLSPSREVRKAIKAFNVKDLSAYLDPTYLPLRRIIAKKHGVRLENIMLSSGADESIGLIPRALTDPGDSSVLAVPTFYRMIEANSMFKVESYFVELKEERGFYYDDDFVKRFVREIRNRRAKTAWICNPNNPTGNVMGREHVEYILKNIPKNCVLVIDEVFFDFYDPTNRKSSIKLMEKYDNLIVLRSLSKSYSLAGIRLGYLVASEKLVESINHIKPVFNINALSQCAAEAALKDHKYIRDVAAETRTMIRMVIHEIGKMENLVIGGNTNTNIFILKHKTKDIYEELKKRRILTADFRHSVGMEKAGYVRVTIQDSAKNKKLLMALREIN